jgi:hypothetical protein
VVIRASDNNLDAVATVEIGALTFSFYLAAKPRHPIVDVSCLARWLLVQHDERVLRSAILHGVVQAAAHNCGRQALSRAAVRPLAWPHL